MSQGRKERADAVRNRRAILEATEKLLATHRASDISMEQVAAEAGVGKGTVFHRFGSRYGLMTALMRERAEALSSAIAQGPPPLGPGAPERDRIFAFLDAVLEMIARNKSLLAELAHAPAPAPASASAASADAGTPAGTDTASEPRVAAESEREPVYSFWHGHLSALLAAERPDVDADLTAHLVLGSLHSEPVLSRLAADGPEPVAAALRTLVSAVLDAPRTPDPAS